MLIDLDHLLLSPHAFARWKDLARKNADLAVAPIGIEYGVIRDDGTLIIACDCGDPPVMTLAMTVPRGEWRRVAVG